MNKVPLVSSIILHSAKSKQVFSLGLIDKLLNYSELASIEKFSLNSKSQGGEIGPPHLGLNYCSFPLNLLKYISK